MVSAEFISIVIIEKEHRINASRYVWERKKRTVLFARTTRINKAVCPFIYCKIEKRNTFDNRDVFFVLHRYQNCNYIHLNLYDIGRGKSFESNPQLNVSTTKRFKNEWEKERERVEVTEGGTMIILISSFASVQFFLSQLNWRSNQVLKVTGLNMVKVFVYSVFLRF